MLSQHPFQQNGVHVIWGYVMGPKVGLRFLEHLSNLSLKRKHFPCVTSDDFFILTYLTLLIIIIVISILGLGGVVSQYFAVHFVSGESISL